MSNTGEAGAILAELDRRSKEGKPSKYCHIGKHFLRIDERCGCYVEAPPGESPAPSATAPDIDRQVKRVVRPRKSRKKD